MIISHFFWPPDTVMQQSVKGLMSSLPHQLLLEEPGVVDHVLHTTAYMLRKDLKIYCSTEELHRNLIYVISRYLRPVAIFLDGLEEVLLQDGVLRLQRCPGGYLRILMYRQIIVRTSSHSKLTKTTGL